MPQLDSFILMSQLQLILFFFLGYYLFIYRILPILFVLLSFSNEFIIYKYYKYELDIERLLDLCSSKHRTKLFSWILDSHLNKASHSDMLIFLNY